jgi:hypothetical protein
VPLRTATAFKQVCVPELRFISAKLYDDVDGMLTYLDDIHRHSQLEELKLTGYVDISNNGNMPRLTDLRRWLTVSKSKDFTFRMNLNVTRSVDGDSQRLKMLLAEYRKATGYVLSNGYRKVEVVYPTMSLIQQMETNDTEINEDSSDESNDGEYLTDVDIEEIRTLSFRCLLSFVYSSTLTNRTIYTTNGWRR